MLLNNVQNPSLTADNKVFGFYLIIILIITFLFIGLITIFNVFYEHDLPPSLFLSIYIPLEVIRIIICALIFIIRIISYRYGMDLRSLFISTGFLMAAIIFSFRLVENVLSLNAEASNQLLYLRYLGRYFILLFLLLASYIPENKNATPEITFTTVFLAILISIAIAILILQHGENLPLILTKYGFSRFGFFSSYTEIALLFVLIFRYGKQAHDTNNLETFFVAASMGAFIVSGFAFSLQNTIDDPLKLVGNFFGAIAFLLISVSFIRSTILQPYDRLVDTTNELSRQSSRLNAALNSIVDGLVIYDDVGKIGMINDAAKKILGYDETILHLDLEQRLTNLKMKTIEGVNFTTENTPARRALRGEFVRAVEMLLTNPEGETYWLNINASPILFSDGSQHGAIMMMYDITHLRQLEKQRELLLSETQSRNIELKAAVQELESFSYSIAHDLRGPLRAITSYPELIIEEYKEKLDPEITDYLYRIKNSGARIGERIDELLEFSRVRMHEMNYATVDMSKIVREITDEFVVNEPFRKAKFIIENNLTATGDAFMLRRVLENLLKNSWKFTANKEITTIEFGCVQMDNIPAFFVKDNGAGFNMDYRNKLFLPFSRLHTVEEFPGSGIGLAIAKRIIERHNGRIWAESKPGEGATFYFTLNEKAEEKEPKTGV
jgi:PAS domain S-box-containing protein